MKKARAIYGCSADSYYATGLEMHDPYLWYQAPSGESSIVVSTLEVDRARRVAKVDKVLELGTLVDEIKKSSNRNHINEAHMVAYLMEQNGTDEVEVPFEFPSYVASELTSLGKKVVPIHGIFFPERAVKTPQEIENIRQAQQINQKGFARAIEIFKQADIGKDNVLVWSGKPLTSEIIQGEMNAEIVRHGGKGFNGGPIVAGGAQAADPHERGHGVLRAHEFIIIDSFPQGPSFYNGDLTRTFLKGHADQWHKDVYAVVMAAQDKALELIKEGMNGHEIHLEVDKVLKEAGFDTGKDDKGRNYGFFHGTGHSLGLEVHDPGPRTISRVDCELKAGFITSVEPGLYYPDKGGVRLEDLVAVTKDGHDNLTTLPRELAID